MTPNENAKYTTYIDVYARLTAIIKNKKINPADILEWCTQCETEWIGDFHSLVPYTKVKIEVRDKMARIPPYKVRILDVFDQNEKKPNYYDNGGSLVLDSDYNYDHVYMNFLGLAIDPKTYAPFIKKGHEEACLRHCIVNLYYEDWLTGKIGPNQYIEMKEERNLQVEAAKQDMSGYDRKELMEITAISLNMYPYVKPGALYHKEIES